VFEIDKPRRARAVADEAVRFEWAADVSAAPTTRGDLERAGADLDPQDKAFRPPAGQELDYGEASFEALTVIAGTMGLVYLAQHLLTFVKDLRSDGIIVDARTHPIGIRPHRALNRGDMLVVTDAGSELCQRGKGPDLAALISAVKPG